MFKDHSLWQIIKIGGPVMYILILCSFLSLTAIVDRLIYYWRRSSLERPVFMGFIKEALTKGEIKKAITFCQNTPTPFAAVICSGLSSPHHTEKEIANAMEREIIVEVNKLEQRTAIIGTIGSTAVYIGLLGTVWGIIGAFRDIAQAGSGGVNIVIRGISEALVCTAAGLFVAIPAVIAYNYFVKRINGFVTDMELCASEMTDLLREKSKGHEKKP